jgi:ABC-2 type transport system ATP-binding protein
MEFVNVTNLKKNYGDLEAVKGVSFGIEEGEVFGLLGPNGAGKTSIINMLIGLSKPSFGSITVGGMDGIKEIKKVQKIIGVVPDENNLYDEMNGFDNLCFCASLYGIKKEERERRAAELLVRFGLEKAGMRPFRTYSKGMKRKLTIAAGIIHDPKLLFLDEPTTGIDVESSRHIRQWIVDLKSSGKTVFLTTHYIEEAERICDRIAFIVEGKIIKIGTLSELMERAEPEHKIILKLDKSRKELKEEIETRFGSCKAEIPDENSCILISKDRVSLSPVLQLLDQKGISVYEAKEIKPSLEDVFVKITGMDAANLKKEKEGAGK